MCIPEGEHEVEIKVFANNISQIEFFLIPTGTQIYEEKHLIGKSTGSEGVFKIKHKFSKSDNILYHVAIKGSNKEAMAVKDILFNVQRCD
ncbi:MAG: hypothetical protein ACQEV7_09280 [Bacillota bacterium]